MSNIVQAHTHKVLKWYLKTKPSVFSKRKKLNQVIHIECHITKGRTKAIPINYPAAQRGAP